MHMKYIYTNTTENKETLRLIAKLNLEKKVYEIFI